MTPSKRPNARIAKVKQGWLIKARSRKDVLRLGAELRDRIPSDEVIARKDGYIVRAAALGHLVDLYPPGQGGWDDVDVQPALSFASLYERQARARLEVAAALEEPHGTLAGYERLDRLDQHQVEAVAAIAAPSLVGLALFDEQGTGKTMTTLAAFDVLHARNMIDKLLVITPKSVISVWQSDATLLWGDSKTVVAAWGSREKRRRKLLSAHDVLLVSYESAVADSVYLRAILAEAGQRYMLVADESYYVKNPAARRSAAVAELRPLCERAVVLCGTPAPNSPIDIIHQMDVADAGVTFGKTSKGQNDSASIRSTLEQSAIVLRRLKEDVLDYCPPKEIERTYVELRPRQSAEYHSTLNALVSDVLDSDEHEFRRNLGSYMARRSALLRICSHPGALLADYTETPAKMLALDRLADELVVERGEKIVVWSFFRYTLDRIADRLRHLGLARIDGSVTSHIERAAAIDSFQHDPSTMVFLGNPAAAGSGITLTAASHAIFESFSNQPAHYLQSVDRIHRRGQTAKVVSHVLIASDSLEEDEFDRLLNKEHLAKELLRDKGTEPVTRHRFITNLGVTLEADQRI